jgi:hypothetical protein
MRFITLKLERDGQPVTGNGWYKPPPFPVRRMNIAYALLKFTR